MRGRYCGEFVTWYEGFGRLGAGGAMISESP
jgi:hypothetical protein